MTPTTDSERWCQRLNIRVDVIDIADFRYLEKRGYRFLIDFGTENAARVRDIHYEYERAERCRLLRKDQL
jgi:hypothetical protein